MERLMEPKNRLHGQTLARIMRAAAGKLKKSGQYSTAVEVLEELAKEYELPRLILEFRQLSKLKSTYIDALPKLMEPTTHRLHTSFNQAGAATGRLSSTNPNLWVSIAYSKKLAV